MRFHWDDSRWRRQLADAADEVLEDAAKKGVEYAKSKCPVKTGDMKNAIGHEKSKYPGGGYIFGVFSSGSGGRWEDSLGARAVFVEYGHAAPGGGRGSVRRRDVQKHVAAKPFLRPAIDRIGRELDGMLREAIG